MESPITAGCRVRLQNLKSVPELNNALGVVKEAPGDSQRIAVNVLGPASKVMPDGVLLKRENISVLPPQKAVKVQGFSVTAVELTPQQSRGLGKWRRCPTPALLGLPLSIYQLNPGQREAQEQMGFYLMAEPSNGFAPTWVQSSGLGPILVARNDGEDFTEREMFELHDYNCHLMDCWGDWIEGGTCGGLTRESQYTPEAYQRFTKQRASERVDSDQEELEAMMMGEQS